MSRSGPPACYLVVWDEQRIIKAGYSAVRRWRKFKGARVARVDVFDRVRHAFALETELDAYLRSIGRYALPDRFAAEPLLGNRGGGWVECLVVPDVEDAIRECERIANAFVQRIAIADATDGRNGPHVQTQMDSPGDDLSPNASRGEVKGHSVVTRVSLQERTDQ